MLLLVSLLHALLLPSRVCVLLRRLNWLLLLLLAEFCCCLLLYFAVQVKALLKRGRLWGHTWRAELAVLVRPLHPKMARAGGNRLRVSRCSGGRP